jgi:NAD(P)H dehydrogenase (quinone)
MRVLLVLAHPLDDSLNAHLASIARDALEGGGHDVTLLDLYRENFDPRLTAAERSAYYDDTPLAVCPGADALAACDVLVLVFPTWWFGFPAILKGWFDRALAPGIAFDHGKDFGPIVPRLTGLRHVVAITTLGSRWWVDRFIMLRPIRRVLKTAILGGCAPGAQLRYLPLYAAERVTSVRLAAYEKALRGALARISV